MQLMTTTERREDSFEKRSLMHKRLERWIRLQQFVYGLPEDDYAYAVCTREVAGRFESHTLVKVGWLTWFGQGRGSDRQHAVAVSLLNTSEAWSARGSRNFLHGLRSWWRRQMVGLGLAAPKTFRSEVKEPGSDRLAS